MEGESDLAKRDERSLDDIVREYMSMPNLSERVDVSKIIKGYDQKAMNVDEGFSFWDIALRNPIPSALAITMAAYTGLALAGATPGTGILFPGILFSGSAIGLGIINDYRKKAREKRQEHKAASESLDERLKSVIINHPKIAGLVSGLSTAGFVEYVNYLALAKGMPADGVTHSFAMMAGVISYLSTGLLSELLKGNDAVSKGFKEYRRRHPPAEGERAKLKVKLRERYDRLMEHPGIGGLLGGAAASAYTAYSLIENAGVSNILPEGWVLLGATTLAAGLLASVPAYLGASALSWSLHSNSLSLMKENTSYGFNRLFGRYEAAAENLRRIMEIPTTKENEQRLHSRLGNVLLKKGDFDEALNEYYRVIELAGAKDRVYTNPLELFVSYLRKLNPLKRLHLDGFVAMEYDALRLVKRAVAHEGEESLTNAHTKRIYQVSKLTKEGKPKKELERLAKEIRSNKMDGADINLRLRIMDDPYEPESHLLYAKFLDAMGDNEMAQDEYRIATSLILDDPELASKFERIGVSRNEVLTYKANKFFNNTLIFKKGLNKELLRQEYENTCYFYEHLREGVAKPLAFIEMEDAAYLITEHSGNKNLNDLIREDRLGFDIASDSIVILHELQEIGERIELDGKN